MFYALEPKLIRTFAESVETACQSPEAWARMHGFLSTMARPQRVSFHVSGPWSILNADDGGVALSPDTLPTRKEKDALLKVFAMRFPACQFLPNETKLFVQADFLKENHPELALGDSREWDLLRNRLFAPDYLPDEFPFLAGDPDNSSASCLTPAEVIEILEHEKQEHLLERGVIGYGSDGLAILGLFQLAAAKGWHVWFHEVS